MKVMDASQNTSLYFCFILDGLDEFVGDIDVLWDMIKVLSGYKNSKICASSRPEQAFLRFFRTAPQLRLQDLTKKDIKLYVEGRIRPELEDMQEECRCSPRHHEDSCAWNLIDTIASKALGVFLWVRIVTQQTVMGFRSGDSISELRKGLEDLPADVQHLYAHMLKKLPESYRLEASTYFELLVASQQIEGSPGLTLLHIGLISHEAWNNVRTRNLGYFEGPSFSKVCQKLELRVLARCAGLVQINDSTKKSPSTYGLASWIDSPCEGELDTSP